MGPGRGMDQVPRPLGCAVVRGSWVCASHHAPACHTVALAHPARCGALPGLPPVLAQGPVACGQTSPFPSPIYLAPNLTPAHPRLLYAPQCRT